MNSKRFALIALALGLLVGLAPAMPVLSQGSDCQPQPDNEPISEGEQKPPSEDCDNDEAPADVKESVRGKRAGSGRGGWASLPPTVARPPSDSCDKLPPRVAVFGNVYGTECQMVGEAGIGKANVLARGFKDAVDVWSYVNGGMEVCFRNSGWLVFLDAAYAPRMVVELESFERDGMTCGAIDGAGTVTLVRRSADGAPAAPPAQATPPPPAEPTLPTFDDIPLSDCQIKLAETLFLRAAPAGEIIGLVWLYSEVPAFEINGDWYKVEFEGQFGYISRFYGKVLRGGCA